MAGIVTILYLLRYNIRRKYSSHVASGQSSRQVLTLLRAVRGDDRILNRYELKLLKRLYHVVKPHHIIHR